MYENSTSRVRVIASTANRICEEKGHKFVSPDHMLRALMQTGNDCYAMRILLHLQVSPQSILNTLEKICTERPDDVIPKETSMKTVMGFADGERAEYGFRHINTGHLLIALKQMNGTIAAQALDQLPLEKLQRTLYEFILLRLYPIEPRLQPIELSPTCFELRLPTEASDESFDTQHEELDKAFEKLKKGLNITSITVNTASS